MRAINEGSDSKNVWLEKSDVCMGCRANEKMTL